MNFLSSFILFVFVTYSNGLPAGVSRRSALPSCPTNSEAMQVFQEVSPCAVYCLEDEDCETSGLACCATDCGSRCVAPAIWKRLYQSQEEETETTEDDKKVDDVISGTLDDSDLKDDKINQELELLKEKLAEGKNQEEQKENNEELIEEQGETKEEGEVKDGEVKDDEDKDVSEEEDAFATQGPLTGIEEGDVEEETLEGDGEEEETEEEEESEEEEEDDGESDDDDDEEEEEEVEDTEEEDGDDRDDEFDTYSTDEDGEEDLEMLLMELLYDLKSKQNAKHSPWNEEKTHTSRSLLQRKGDFMENAMPPPNALETGALNEETRALDDQLGGYFIDRPFKMDEMKNQEAIGRRSSMERRDEGFVNEKRKNKELLNQSNIMRR